MDVPVKDIVNIAVTWKFHKGFIAHFNNDKKSNNLMHAPNSFTQSRTVERQKWSNCTIVVAISRWDNIHTVGRLFWQLCLTFMATIKQSYDTKDSAKPALYIYIYICIELGKKAKRLRFRHDKPVLWLTHSSGDFNDRNICNYLSVNYKICTIDVAVNLASLSSCYVATLCFSDGMKTRVHYVC